MKRFEFVLTDYETSKIIRPIRTKQDLLAVLAATLEYLLTPKSITATQNTNTFDSVKLVLYIDKMSRLFFCCENKIFSFQFPFTVYSDANNNQITSIIFQQENHEIDHIDTSLLKNLFNDKNLLNFNLKQIEEKISEEIIENGWETTLDESDCLQLVSYLMLFEPGYLRYEHDEEHADPLRHPKHHMDWFYSDNNAVKLGLKSSIDCNGLINLLDKNTSCKYIW